MNPGKQVQLRPGPIRLSDHVKNASAKHESRPGEGRACQELYNGAFVATRRLLDRGSERSSRSCSISCAKLEINIEPGPCGAYPAG